MATARSSDMFGDVAVEIGLVTPGQVVAALDQQHELGRRGTQKPIGEILVEHGVVTPEQVTEVLRAQKERRAAHARHVGPYQIIERIGEGGMGAVYRARDSRTGKHVALKILPPRLASNARYLMRFFQEARMAEQLDHENIVKGLGIGESEGVQFFAMEFVDGENIQDMLARVECFPEETALKIILSVANALDHAHEHGLVHQDIKPENIIMDRKGVVKLLDLGLARRVNDLTKSRLGTPLYVSPEHVKGDRPLDIRSDIYSLGVTLYHMVTGSPPFIGTDEHDTMTRHVEDELTWPQDVVAELSDGICQVIARMLAKDPGDRYAEPKELISDLEALLDGETPHYAGRLADGPRPASTKSSIRRPCLTAKQAAAAEGAAEGTAERRARETAPTETAARKVTSDKAAAGAVGSTKLSARPGAVGSTKLSARPGAAADRKRRRGSGREPGQPRLWERGTILVYVTLGVVVVLLTLAAYLVFSA